MFQLPIAPPPAPEATFSVLFEHVGPALFGLGWIIVVYLVLFTAWESYQFIKKIDYVSSVEWTFFQITLPVDSMETPKSMELLFDVIGGIHKSPDLNELYFDGYLEAWYSCELHCTPGKARYIMVVPTAHRNFFEGIIYGQYPRAEIKEVEDYTQRFRWQDIRKTYDLYGTEIVLVEDDIYPIKTHREFEATLAEEEHIVDPHQGMVEAFTNIQPGEEYWVQVVVRPKSAAEIDKWSLRGKNEVAVISGQSKKEADQSLIGKLLAGFVSSSSAIISALFTGVPAEAAARKEEYQLHFFNPVDEAKMKGITQKISNTGHKTKIRIIHIAPLGQLKKPNIGRAIGAFKQFNTPHLNSLKPDDKTKTNGPVYVLREKRRMWRERVILLLFQWRDMFGADAGQWFTSEELATLYHFPVKYVPSPSVERAKAGVRGPPDNVPYA